ncbi:MAG: VanZ family protein, partial [bacterium]
ILQRFLLGFLIIYFLLQVLPLDLTISPVEIYHKWRAGGIVLKPLANLKSGGWREMTGSMAGFFIFVLLGYLAVLSGVISGNRAHHFKIALFWGVMISGFAEFLQLFVYSRVSDISDVISASFGAGMGALVAKSQQKEYATGARLDFARHKWAWSVLLFYSGLLTYYYWQPFDFGLSKSELLGRLQHLLAIPFQSYINAVGNDGWHAFWRQMLFFLPLGIMLYFCLKEWQRADRILIASFALFSIAALIELGQLFIASRFADNTDMLVAWLGGLSGFVLPGKLRRLLVRLKLAQWC